MRVRVKICGITRPEDARAAAEAGADALGLVFYARSPRAVTAEQAAALCAGLPPFVTSVGLFVDPAAEEVRRVLEGVPLDLLQFHGDEPADFCRQFGRPYLKALAMRPDVDIAARVADYPDAAGILLDAWHPAVPGGSGETFDWDRIPRELAKPVVLAGGLHPGNVAEAIERTRPWAVDVSSGVEADKGIKDPALIRAFIRGVNSVHSQSGD
ncbi:phosphoribosylanthranilate isomerase [Thiohalobacter sp. IOR34]|nr:phosphoribosylanthranilate isomerase [Thiohalobacter sp. IOR34]WJW76836.1 phosphoribosylanthranilate isomerase [Thiohalobacter sp. IOR34]